MSMVTRDVLVEAPIERFYDILVDYERYPEFVPGIRACRVRRAEGDIRVEYELDVGVRRIRYVLRHEEERPRSVRWSLVSGEMLRVSNGSWELSPERDGTRATYSVDIQIARPPLVPRAIIDRVSDELARVQLPRTLAAFKARAERRA